MSDPLPLPVIPDGVLTESFRDIYSLVEAEVEILSAIGHGLTLQEMSVSGTPVRTASLASLKDKTNCKTMKLLFLLGQWMLSGERPEHDPHEAWKCLGAPAGCGITRSLSHFPMFPVDLRCDDCIYHRTRAVVGQKRIRGVEDALKTLFHDANQDHMEIPKAEKVLSSLVMKLGGERAVGQQWAFHLQRASEERPGSKMVLDHFRDISRFMVAAQESLTSHANIKGMDMEEAREYLTQLVITELAKQNKTHLLDELVMEDPALIAEILDGAP